MLKTFKKKFLREKIIEGFKNRVFPLYYNEIYEQMEASAKEEEEERKKEQEELDEKTTVLNKLNKWIINEEINLNEELFRKYFNFQTPSDMLMLLNKINDKTKNNELVNITDSGLKDFKKEINKLSEEERMTEKSDKIVKIVKKNS